MSSNTRFRSIFEWGMWVQGADSPATVLRAAAPCTLEGYAPLITCPTLVLDGENDLACLGLASQLYQTLRCQKTYHLFPAPEGGGEHCQAGTVSRLHQVVFDWLGTVLGTPNMTSRSVS
jgi:pimeloyl-ACP methyl ester carboxylesterase